MEEVVDLTGESPPFDAGKQKQAPRKKGHAFLFKPGLLGAGTKRKHDSGREEEENEEGQRWKIMAHARQAAAAAPPAAAAAAAAGTSAAGGRAEPGGCTEAEEAAARQKIMQFARLRALELREQAAPAPSSAAPGGAGGPEAGGNSLLASLHRDRLERQQRQGGGGGAPPVPASTPARPSAPALPPLTAPAPPRLSLLTWNVWFREDVQLLARMEAIGREVVALGLPDFICLQEATPNIVTLLARQPFWRHYSASPPDPGAPYFTLILWRAETVRVTSPVEAAAYPNSIMGRDLKTLAATVGGLPVRVATTHLESPLGWNQMFSSQRVEQFRRAVERLDRSTSVDCLFAGDMNWGPDDGQPPLPGGWGDAWLHTQPPSAAGLTYDPKQNPMLKKGNRIRRRLDRVFTKLRAWRLVSSALVGTAALQEVSFEGRPVLPSDHFGLHVTLASA